MMERAKGQYNVGNVLDSRRDVGKGVDRGHAGVVNDDRGLLCPSLMRYP